MIYSTLLLPINASVVFVSTANEQFRIRTIVLSISFPYFFILYISVELVYILRMLLLMLRKWKSWMYHYDGIYSMRPCTFHPFLYIFINDQNCVLLSLLIHYVFFVNSINVFFRWKTKLDWTAMTNSNSNYFIRVIDLVHVELQEFFCNENNRIMQNKVSFVVI